jgi:AraC-like DNA-binding protein
VEVILTMSMEMIEEWTQAIYEVQFRRTLSPAIRDCQEYIFRNLHAKITLDDLARVSGFSVPYLSTLFKKEVGQTITAYILALKVKTAQELLLNTRRTSKSIAYLLNFSSQSYFIRCFKRVAGMTPREYRRRMGN